MVFAKNGEYRRLVLLYSLSVLNAGMKCFGSAGDGDTAELSPVLVDSLCHKSISNSVHVADLMTMGDVSRWSHCD